MILPGSLEDDIKLRIFHTALDHSSPPPTDRRMPLHELTRTLRHPWRVVRTLDDRYIFLGLNESGKWFTTWEHPDPNLDRSAYQLQWTDSTSSGDGVAFEALSYVWGFTPSNRFEEAYVEVCLKLDSQIPKERVV